jgi:hypothetical protein
MGNFIHTSPAGFSSRRGFIRQADFVSVKASRIGELSARFDIVLGVTA